MDLKEIKQTLLESLNSLEQTKQATLRKLEEIEKELEQKPKFDYKNWLKQLEEFKGYVEVEDIKIGDIIYYCDEKELKNILNFFENYCESASNIKIYEPLQLCGVTLVVPDDARRGFRYKPQKPKFNEPWTPKEGDIFWFIEDNLTTNFIDFSEDFDKHYKNILIHSGNCFKTEQQAEQRAKEIKVYNLLKNFSLANGGDRIAIGNKKYFILEDITSGKHENKFKISNLLDIEFYSQEVAEEAFRRYKKELEELGK